jgi:phosphatidylethanolamine/phosphatidyl-N-methylethanolamine N-methyltransferase
MNRDIQKLVDDYYLNFYQKIHSNLESEHRFSFHFRIELKRLPKSKYPVVLELGSGNGSHIKFVKHYWEVYLLTDVRDIKSILAPTVEIGLIPVQTGVYKSYADATELRYANDSIDRIVSGCLLLHLDDQIGALEEWLRVLKPKGVIDTLIPNDQSPLIGLYRILFSRRRAKRYGFRDFDLVNAFEHRTYYQRIFKLVIAHFPPDQYEFEHFPPYIGRLSIFRAFSILRLRKL